MLAGGGGGLRLRLPHGRGRGDDRRVRRRGAEVTAADGNGRAHLLRAAGARHVAWPPTRPSGPDCGSAARRPSAPWAVWRPATSPWTWSCPWASCRAGARHPGHQRRHGVEVATAFHAGDGNLHPGVHYDDRDPRATRRAHAAADEIMRRALRRGGSITGEHGVGIEKLHALPWQLDAESARLMRGIKRDVRSRRPAESRQGASRGEMRTGPPPSRCRTGIDFDWDSLTVTAPAGDVAGARSSRRRWRGDSGFPWVLAAAGAGGDAAAAERGRAGGPSADRPDSAGRLARRGTSCSSCGPTTGDGRASTPGRRSSRTWRATIWCTCCAAPGGMLVEPPAATFQLRPAPTTARAWHLAGPRRRRGPGALDPCVVSWPSAAAVWPIRR